MTFRTNRIWLFVFLCSFAFVKIKAQVAYTFSPSTTYHVILDTNQINYDGIEIVNTGTTNLILTYQLVKKDTLIDSHFDLCNSGTCLLGLVPYGSIATILPGNFGWLKMHQYSGKALGTNTIKYVVRDGISRTDTLTFIIDVNNPSGINENAASVNAIRVFPNPVSNGLFFINSKSENSLLKIMDLNGKELYSEKISKGLNRISVAELNIGIYFYKITDRFGLSKSGKMTIIE